MDHFIVNIFSLIFNKILLFYHFPEGILRRTPITSD